MGQSVRLSDALVLEARLTSEFTERSIAAQIEHWAALGKIVDSLLRGKDAQEVRKNAGNKSLSECLAEVETSEGQQSLRDFLQRGPFPRYEPAEGKPGWLLRTERDGTRATGRFIKRQFVEYPGET